MEPNRHQVNLYKAGAMFLIILSVLVVGKAVMSITHWGDYGRKGSMDQISTITLSGHGEVQAVPDIANIYFTIRKEAKTVKGAQDAVAVVEAQALASLKANGVLDKDIQAQSASFNPKYEYTRSASPAIYCDNLYGCPPYPGTGKSVITGYEAWESITVKVRNTDSVGKIMQDLGALGVTELSGPNFTIDDEEILRAQARKEAIAEARAKAEVLAKDLGVRLVRVTSFSENGAYPMPMYYDKAVMNAESGAAAPAVLPVG